ncbi:hypothetical protein M405DRAFT_397096 [Rhizopogon salebrosus TDB-379]|nr:hypothetical protein M405DRAFT_397096 [Rhizopogon salebrosus TDB-379]
MSCVRHARLHRLLGGHPTCRPRRGRPNIPTPILHLQAVTTSTLLSLWPIQPSEPTHIEKTSRRP